MKEAAAPMDLEGLLRRRASTLRLPNVSAGYFSGRDEFYATTAHEREGSLASSMRVSSACVIKLATTALIVRAFLDGKLTLADSLDDAWRAHCGQPLPAFSGISLRQLIDHTHGIDGSDLQEATFDAASYIHAAPMMAALAARRPLSEPGCLYSYGHAGYLILGALLERTYATRYSELLDELLLAPVGIHRTAQLRSMPVCPSTAPTLTLSVAESIALLKEYARLLERAAARSGQFSAEHIWDSWRPLPGWSSADSGYSFGWRYQCEGWFNLSGRGINGEVMMIKWNPKAELGLAVAGPDLRVLMLSDQLASDLWRLPTRPSGSFKTAEPAVEPVRYAGCFEDCVSSITIEETSAGLRMKARVRSDAAGSQPQTTTVDFRRPDNGLAFSATADNQGFFFLHFICDGPGRGTTHLWNGLRVWPRSDVHC